MNKNEVREDLKNKLTDYVGRITQKSKGKDMYVCPLCHSGTGRSKTGAFSIIGTQWKCFSCDEGGDIFDLIGRYEGIKDYTEQFKRACNLYGISIDKNRNCNSIEQYTHIHTHTDTHKETMKTEQEDFTAFYLKANKDIDKTDYHRGISIETLNKYKVGYIAEWKHPKAQNAPTSPRLIVPVSKYSYLARDTRENLTDQQEQYKKQKVKGIDKPLWIFNIQALEKAEKPIFIVEGEIDALSIIDVGGEAVGLGSIAYINQLLEIVGKKKPTQALIVCLDNEQKEQVQKARKQLEDGFTKLGIAYYNADITGQYKDANEALNADREAFKKLIEQAENKQTMEGQEAKEAYLQTATSNYITAFMNGIADSVNTPYTPTGFKKLDEVLDGGLYEGLYILGAGTSQGKTALIMQIADYIARAEKDILVFSLEMARNELISRSVSRHTFEIALQKNIDTKNAKTARGITTGKKWNDYNDTETDLIYKAVEEYSKYAKHIYIQEGVGNIGIEEVRETIKNHIHYTGNTPIVIIDYMQILAPVDIRATDKQNTDKVVIELKRLTRDYKLTAIALSSFNRTNYNTDVAESAFKESGAIEYSADVLLGLQFTRVKDKDYSKEAEEKKYPREMQIKVIKNRNGRKGDTINYDYYSKFNTFVEAD